MRNVNVNSATVQINRKKHLSLHPTDSFLYIETTVQHISTYFCHWLLLNDSLRKSRDVFDGSQSVRADWQTHTSDCGRGGRRGPDSTESAQKGNDRGPRGEYINTAEAPPSSSAPHQHQHHHHPSSPSPQRSSACPLIHLSLTRISAALHQRCVSDANGSFQSRLRHVKQREEYVKTTD